MLVAFRAVHVTVFFLFVAGFADFGDFHVEVQGFTGQRMVAVHGDFLAFHGGDGEDARAGLGLGLELHARLQLAAGAFEGGRGNLLDQAFMALAVAFFRGHLHFQLVAGFLAHQRFLQARNDVAVAMQVVQRFLALTGGIDGLAGVVGQGVVKGHYLVVCDLHGCPFGVECMADECRRETP